MWRYKIQTGFLLIALLLSQIMVGQKIDSLQLLLSQTHDLERKIDLQTKLAKQYQTIDLTEARNYADKALKLSQTIESTTYLGEIFGLFGDIAVLQDSLSSAQFYYEQALVYFNEINDLKGVTGVTHVLGNIALTHDDLTVAMQYYLETIDYAKSSGLEDRLPGIYLNIGSIYYKSGALREAQEYYSLALEGIQLMENELLLIDVYNNLGATYLDLDEIETAKEYFIKAFEKSIELEAFVRACRSLQNLSMVYQTRRNYIKAIETLLEAEMQLLKENPNYAGPRQPIWATNKIYLGINYFHLNNEVEAYKNLSEGLKLSRKSGQLRLSALAMKYLSDYWENNGNIDSAFIYYKMQTDFQDSLNTKDNIRKLAIQEAQFKHDEELILEKQDREKESAKSRLYLFVSVAVIILLVLLAVLLLLFLKLGRNRIKQVELEQSNLRKELEIKNKELTTHLMYQVKNNEFILNISKKLKSVLAKAVPENKSLVNELIREIEIDSNANQWEEFEVRFQQVHTGFYKNVAQRFTDLTSNELKLCAFLKLNMSTKDIAAITYQSTNSITVARWRLRQKFGLSKEESLATFLTQF